MSLLFWKAREARRKPDVTLDTSEQATPTPGAPTVTYTCNTYRCPQKDAKITIELSVQSGFVIGNLVPICVVCGKNAAKSSTAGIGSL